MKRAFYRLSLLAAGVSALTNCKGAPIVPAAAVPVADPTQDSSSSNSSPDLSFADLPECKASETEQCPNWSGHYLIEDHPNYLDANMFWSQTDCSNVHLDFKQSGVEATMDWVADGLTHVMKLWTQTSHWQGSCLINVISIEGDTKRTVYEKLPTGDLKEIVDDVRTSGQRQHLESIYHRL